MRRAFPVLAAAALLSAVPATLAAQSGFALKGHYLFNESSVEDNDGRDIPSADGFSVGAELVLPLSIGVGVSAYTTGTARDVNIETTSFGVLAEANYFLDLPILPVTPYAGVHVGLGRFTVDDLDDADPEIEDGTTQLGFQVGVRLQLNSLLGIDAQYRRMSESADEADGLERNQFLIGIAVF